MNRILNALCLFVSCGVLPVMATEASASPARQILAYAGRDRGVALVADGGNLASALVTASGMIVVDQQPDEPHRSTAALAADKAGTLGRKLYVAVGSPSACVLADGYADIVVLASATDKTLTPESAKELARVVAPYGGTVVAGNPGGESAGLSRAALAAWAAKLGDKAEIKSEGGLWAVWKRPALPGGDDWSHWYGDAGGNPANKDTAFTYPFELAWTAKPMQTTRTENRVAAGGRLFSLMRPHQNEGMFQTHRFEGGNEIIARSLANGEILWRYPLGDDAYAMRSSLIATPEVVYVMRREKVVVLDAQTGKEREPVVLASAPGEIKAIWLRNGVLVGLVGATRDVPEFCPTANVKVSINKFKTITAEASYGFGDTLVAWNVGSGKEQWRWKAPAPVDSRIVGITPGGMVLAYAKDTAVVGLDLKDGKEHWKQADSAVLAKITNIYPSEDWGWNAVSRPGLVMNDTAALIAHAGSTDLVALSPVDGHLLWSRSRSGAIPVQAAILGDLFVATSIDDPHPPGSPWKPSNGVWVTADGSKAMQERKSPLHLNTLFSCGQVTASGRYVMGCGGGPAWEIATQKELLPTLAKAECSQGVMVAAGTMVQVPGACSGCNRIMGFLAMRSFSKINLRVPADDPGRLVRGDGIPGPGVATDPKDWPTGKHDATRSAGAPVNISTQAVIRWHWNPTTPYPVTGGNIFNVAPIDAEYRLTQPVTVGDLVVVAGGEGVVTGLDRVTGKEHWRATLGGRIHASPTIAGGRVFVGCADGTLSVLSPVDGRLIWRYRIAPVDRRVMSYGHLESSWPVLCSPVVDGDTVYAAAGRPMVPGGYIVALDVATGTPRWMQSYIPYSGDELPADDRFHLKDPGQTWVVPYGELALQGEHLVVRTRNSTGFAGLILDRKTGKPATKQTLLDHDLGESVAQGGESAILPNGLILGGGYKVDVDQNWSSYFMGSTGAGVIDADGTVRVGLLAEATGGWMGTDRHFPCWLGNRLVLPGFAACGLQAFDLAEWQAAVAPKLLRQPPNGHSLKLEVKPLWGPLAPDTAKPVEDKWAKVGSEALGVVLGQNAVVATSRKQAPMDEGPFKGEWFKLAKIVGGQVSALDAASGALRWTVELPAAPALESLALDRDGNALIGLQDGSLVCVGQP